MADENYVLHIPEGIPLDAAAPLLCAGITTYSPLRHWGAGPGTRVAVIGMGGLGHMAVQIAHAMGAHVTVLSHAREEGRGLRLGADEYFATSAGDLHRSRSPVRPHHQHGWPPRSMTRTSRRSASTARSSSSGRRRSPQIRVFSLIGSGRSLAGSNIGGIRETQEMLDFCAEHGIASVIETIGADEVTGAYARVVRGDVRYRFVIDVSTIG